MTLVTYSDPFHSRASFDKKIFAQKSNEIGHKTALIKEASSIYDIHVKALFGNTGYHLMGLGPNPKKIPHNSEKQIWIPEGV